MNTKTRTDRINDFDEMKESLVTNLGYDPDTITVDQVFEKMDARNAIAGRDELEEYEYGLMDTFFTQGGSAELLAVRGAIMEVFAKTGRLTHASTAPEDRTKAMLAFIDRRSKAINAAWRTMVKLAPRDLKKDLSACAAARKALDATGRKLLTEMLQEDAKSIEFVAREIDHFVGGIPRAWLDDTAIIEVTKAKDIDDLLGCLDDFAGVLHVVWLGMRVAMQPYEAAIKRREAIFAGIYRNLGFAVEDALAAVDLIGGTP